MIVANQSSFCVIYYCFYYFYDKPLPIDNEYFKNYNAWVNRGPFEAAPLLILHLFRGGKVCQLFSQASIWKNNQKIVSPLIGFAHIWHSVFQIIYLTIIPRARTGSESIAHEAEGRMDYWLRGHEGESNNCFSKIQLVGQKYRE